MNVTIKGGEFSPKEIEQYKEYLEKKFPNCEIESMTLTVDETDKDYVQLDYTIANKKDNNIEFERIRRVTGYLGNVTRINNAKQHEIQDRVIHEND